MRIIFLDIDGVLHPAGGSATSQVKGVFCRENMSNLAKICLRVNDIKIVLSSSWRTSTARIEVINKALRKYGLPSVFSCTPYLPEKTRVDEIWTWLQKYQTKRMEDPDHFEPITGYLCLDDTDLTVRSTMAPLAPSPIVNHCCRVSSEFGLTFASVKRCARILMRDPDLPCVDIFNKTIVGDSLNFSAAFHAENRDFLIRNDPHYMARSKFTRYSQDGMIPLPTRFNKSNGLSDEDSCTAWTPRTKRQSCKRQLHFEKENV